MKEKAGKGKTRLGLQAAIERARQAEAQIFGLLQKAIQENKANSISRYQRLHKDALDTLRKAEKDLPSVQRDTAKLVPVEEAARELVLMAGEIRSLLLVMPRSLAPRLENRKAVECEALLREEVDSILRSLADGK